MSTDSLYFLVVMDPGQMTNLENIRFGQVFMSLAKMLYGVTSHAVVVDGYCLLEDPYVAL